MGSEMCIRDRAPNDVAGKPRPAGLYAVCLGMVGVEASISFCDFVENYESVISAEDILERWEDIEDKCQDLNAEAQGALIDKLSTHFAENEWKKSHADDAGAFANTLSDELLVHFWNSCTKTSNVPNIQKLHKLLGQRVVEAVKASRNV